MKIEARLYKNGSEISTSSMDGAPVGGADFWVSKYSSVLFELTAPHSCRHYGVSNYTVRFSVYTDSFSGTITKDVDIIFTPILHHSVIGLEYLKKAAPTIQYRAYASGDGLPPGTSVTATDSAGNTWTIYAPSNSSSEVDNPSGGNYYSPTALYVVSLNTYEMYVETGNEILWTGSVGSTIEQGGL
jgi:hypothetical protein